MTHTSRAALAAAALAALLAAVPARAQQTATPTAAKVVDEKALIHHLETGRIAGAALDAFWAEPLPEDHPFWGMKNVILTPHVGGMSEFCVDQVLSIFEENLRRFLKGEIRNLINFIER